MFDAALHAPSADSTLLSVPVSRTAAALSRFGPYRLLIVGSALAARNGIGYHSLKLSDAVARRLTDLVGHDVVMVSHLTTQSTLGSLEREMSRRDLSTFDALILCLDQRSSRASISTAAHHVHRLVKDVWLRVVPGSLITLILPPASITGWSAERTTEFSFELRSRINELIRVVELIDRNGDGAIERDQETWVDDIAEVVAAGLLDPLEELDPGHASRGPGAIPPSIFD